MSMWNVRSFYSGCVPQGIQHLFLSYKAEVIVLQEQKWLGKDEFIIRKVNEYEP